MSERPLPHSADAERAVLGSILLDNSLVNQAIELLRPDDFYVRAHQFVFRAMISLSERTAGETNPILLGEEMRRDGTLEQVGGVAFISELSYGLPHFANLAGYAKVVKDHSLMRQLVKVANKITSEALEGEDEAHIILDHAHELFIELKEEGVRAGSRESASLLTSFAEFMCAEFDDEEEIAFHARRGELVLVQSVTNHGKSTLIRNAALALSAGIEFLPAVEGGKPRRVLLLNLEGSAGWFQFDLRVMTRDLPSHEIELIRTNFLPTHAPMLDGEPLSLPRHMRVLESDVRRAGGVDVLIIDTASAGFSLKCENDNAEVSNGVMKPLVKLARRLNCLIVLVHHVGKAKAEEGATREQAHRGRGASAWGDFSTSIFNLDADPNDRERVTITCGKRKNGANYEQVLRLDREARWFKASGETPVKPVTNDGLLIKVLESAGATQMSTGEIERALAGKMSRSTIMNCLKRLAAQGKISSPRRGYWALLKSCPTCLTPMRDWTTCTNCTQGEKPLHGFILDVDAATSSNGNGFHGGNHVSGR